MAITVSSGGNSNRVEGFEGQTICEVREAFKRAYRIDDSAVARLNNEPVDGGVQVRDGDSVSFDQATAQKG